MTIQVLVVDDEEQVRELAARVLERAGYVVRSVASAAQALDVISAESIDLVVSDVVMPGLSGIDLLTELRRRQLSVPVVLTTGGSAAPERTAEALALEACTVVHKPYTHSELTNAVAEALAGSSRDGSAGT